MEKNISLACILVFGCRLVYLGASVGDAAALAALCSLYGYILHLESKREKPINEQVRSEIAQLRLQVEQVKDTTNGLKLAKTFNRN